MPNRIGTCESDIRDVIYEYLLRTGRYRPVWRVNQDYRYRRQFFQEAKGVPDILATQKETGRMVAVEVKKPGGVVSPEQRRFLEAIHDSGGVALVATCLDDVRDAGL